VPAVSIIIPAYNRAKFLRSTIDSVFAQSYSDWELIIADDGSEDPETRDYLGALDSPRIRTLRLIHSGNPSRARNAAVAVATGEYLAFLDSDDLWHPSKLQMQIEAMRSPCAVGWSYTAVEHIDADGQPIPKKGPAKPRPQGWIFEKLLRLDIGIAMPTVMARRDLISDVGAFDEQQLFGEFHDLCLRLALRSEVVSLPQTLCSIRVHNQHYSADRVADSVGWMRLYEKMSVLAPNESLRAFSRRQRSRTSLLLARAWSEQRNYPKVLSSLARAMRYSWRYPDWWWGAIKRVLQSTLRKSPSSE
jgi:glycosyltransferase involved in cell wall biosynthesis